MLRICTISFIIFLFALFIIESKAQQPTWKLWASGLPSGVYPRMAIAPNHDIFYTLLGTGINLGYIYKANTQNISGSFVALPQIPRPASIQNNIVALGYNKHSEAIAGIYRTDLSHPWIFVFNNQTQQWDTSKADREPSLGAHCLVTSKDGAIYMGTRWSHIYKSTDDGKTFTAIDDTKSVKTQHPCYYPSLENGSELNGAIFSINIDNHGRIYAGTETAGIIFSDDEGAHWHPADYFACMQNDSSKKNPNSPMTALSLGGNVAALGFTKEDNLVWSGADMWKLGWKNKMGYADMSSGTAQEIIGLPDYLVQTGQQVSKIVTTTNGQMFFHSGSSNGASANQIGIYTSRDGIHWSLFNDGITGQNDGLSQGSLAVDGNKVFMATHDGQVWIYEDTLTVSNKNVLKDEDTLQVFPNPARDFIKITLTSSSVDLKFIKIFNSLGHCVKTISVNKQDVISLEVIDLPAGCYFIKGIGNLRFVKF